MTIVNKNEFLQPYLNSVSHISEVTNGV